MMTDNVDDLTAPSPTVAPPGSKVNWRISVVGLLLLAVFVGLFLTNKILYARVIGLWSFHAAPTPFLDMEGPVAWIRCWRMGVDVLTTAPCDVLNRPLVYSPLVLRLPLPWVAPESTPVYAVLLDGIFLISLAVLPRPRRPADAVPLLLGVFSPFCMFGMERANLDLLMFALTAFAVLCFESGPAVRVVGYAAVMAAGSLKFYPWVLLVLLSRERRRLFVGLSGIVVAMLAGFFWEFRAELPRVVANLPDPVFFDDAFGAPQIPYGLVAIISALGWKYDHVDQATFVLFLGSKSALYGVTLIAGLRLGRGAALDRAISRLSIRESLTLWAGAALMCGSFFPGTSIGYRAIFLLFALPGMAALTRVADDVTFRRRVSWTVGVTVVLMWSLPIQRVIADIFGKFWAPTGVIAHPFGTLAAGAGFWLLREGMWWWLMTFLFAVNVRMVLNSRAWADTVQAFAGRRA